MGGPDKKTRGKSSTSPLLHNRLLAKTADGVWPAKLTQGGNSFISNAHIAEQHRFNDSQSGKPLRGRLHLVPGFFNFGAPPALRNAKESRGRAHPTTETPRPQGVSIEGQRPRRGGSLPRPLGAIVPYPVQLEVPLM